MDLGTKSGCREFLTEAGFDQILVVVPLMMIMNKKLMVPVWNKVENNYYNKRALFQEYKYWPSAN